MGQGRRGRSRSGKGGSGLLRCVCASPSTKVARFPPCAPPSCRSGSDSRSCSRCARSAKRDFVGSSLSRHEGVFDGKDVAAITSSSSSSSSSSLRASDLAVAALRLETEASFAVVNAPGPKALGRSSVPPRCFGRLSAGMSERSSSSLPTSLSASRCRGSMKGQASEHDMRVISVTGYMYIAPSRPG